MERLIRLNQLWSWLPAFRAVAETEHLHEAAALVHLTPSTLSRAVHLLEDDVGQALFRRVGRSIELTDAGQTLLVALREAMRRLDDGLAVIAGAPTGPLRVAADDAVALAVVLGAVDDLRGGGDVRGGEACGGGTADGVVLAPVAGVAAQLLRGSIDVAFTSDAVKEGPLVVERLGELRYAVYCGATHPLARAKAPTAASWATHPFIDAPGLPWPPEQPRAIGLRVGGAALAIAACAAGRGLALLPVDAASGLHRVVDAAGRDLVSLAQPLYAVHRRPLSSAGSVEELVAAVRARLAAPRAVEQPVRIKAMDAMAAGA